MLDYKHVLYHIAQWNAQKGQYGGLDHPQNALPTYHVSKVMVYNERA